uniref:Uncharacterized protein n=1 Tax=Panagrolaimus sp. PS1159 TaxID=55785 RepID=A0AC35EZM5_9BILA
MSSEKEAILRKAAMLISINKNFPRADVIEEAGSLNDDVIDDMDKLEEFGTMCLKKSFKCFLAQNPNRLTKDFLNLKKQ